ncbi:MAG: plasmid stabilization protein [Burkholderiaceae bacterium]
MTTLTIRDLDDDMKARLGIRAALHGRSMADEARSILQEALSQDPKPGTGAALVADIRARVEPFGGVELELPPREPMRDPPRFNDHERDE